MKQPDEKSKEWRSLVSAWKEYQWSIMGLLALLAFILGILGFADYFSANGQAISFWDLVYLSLQLFTLESGSLTGDLSWKLQIARLLAPGVLVFTAIKALLVIFHDQLQLFRLRRISHHVVICGLGEKGYRLAVTFAERGDKVVGIEMDAEGGKVDLCREQGVVVLQGNAADRDQLQHAGVSRADYIFSVCGNDDINAMIATYARAEALHRSGVSLKGYVHISDPELTELLRAEDLATSKNREFVTEYFNIYERGAHALLTASPAFPEATDDDAVKVCRISIAGLDRLGTSLVVNLVRVWKSAYEHINVRLHLTLVDDAVDDCWVALTTRYPQLKTVTDIQLVSTGVDSGEFREAVLSTQQLENVVVSRTYVCHEDELLSLSEGLKLQRILDGMHYSVVICTDHESGLAMRPAAINSVQAGAVKLESFGLIDRTCTPELIYDSMYESLARGIHEEYVLQEYAVGHTPETNPSMVAWDALPETLKNSNRDQAHHIGTKLGAVGCALGPVRDWGKKQVEFESEEIELMAVMEHERWCEERIADGWKYAPGEKDIDAKTSPHLVGWDEKDEYGNNLLSEDIKKLDRDAVRHIPTLVTKSGFEVY